MSDPCRVSTSSTANGAGRNRVRASMTFTSAANPKPVLRNGSKSVANPGSDQEEGYYKSTKTRSSLCEGAGFRATKHSREKPEGTLDGPET